MAISMTVTLTTTTGGGYYIEGTYSDGSGTFGQFFPYADIQTYLLSDSTIKQMMLSGLLSFSLQRGISASQLVGCKITFDRAQPNNLLVFTSST